MIRPSWSALGEETGLSLEAGGNCSAPDGTFTCWQSAPVLQARSPGSAAEHPPAASSRPSATPCLSACRRTVEGPSHPTPELQRRTEKPPSVHTDAAVDYRGPSPADSSMQSNSMSKIQEEQHRRSPLWPCTHTFPSTWATNVREQSVPPAKPVRELCYETVDLSFKHCCGAFLTSEGLTHTLQSGEHLCRKQRVISLRKKQGFVVRVQPVCQQVWEPHNPTLQCLSELRGIRGSRPLTVGPQQFSKSAVLKKPLGDADQEVQVYAGPALEKTRNDQK